MARTALSPISEDSPQEPVSAPLKELFRQCDDIAKSKAGDTHGIGALLQKMIITYYQDVRKQAMQAFWSALGAAGVGMLFFLFGISQTMRLGGNDSSRIGFWAGALAQFISAVNFYLYFKAARQFASFHICLERTNRFLLANTIAETLEPATRDDVRRMLVTTIATAPMLSLETVTGRSGAAQPT